MPTEDNLEDMDVTISMTMKDWDLVVSSVYHQWDVSCSRGKDDEDRAARYDRLYHRLRAQRDAWREELGIDASRTGDDPRASDPLMTPDAGR